MNAIIKELAQKSHKEVIETNDFNGAGYVTSQFDEDLFAQLIIQECFKLIKKDLELAHIQLIPLDFGMYANNRLRRIIKDHFGSAL